MAPSASFHRAAIRFSSSILLGIASSSLLLSGCDSATSKTDKEITAKLQQAQDKASAAGVAPTATNGDLSTAASETGDSLPVQIHAKVAFADSELQLAQTIAATVQTNDMQIDRLEREIGLLAGQIDSNNQLITALKKYDPAIAVPQGKSVLDSVNDTKASVTGSDDKPTWVTTDKNTLAALAVVDKNIAGLQADVTRLTDALKGETDERNKDLDLADKLTQQSQHEPGDKSVDTYTQGSEARRKGAELTVKIDADTAELARKQADLGVQQGQHDSLTATLKLLDVKAQAVDTDWKNIQAQMATLTTSSTDLLGTEPVTIPTINKKGDLVTDSTIASKASAIKKLGDDNRKLRALAETHFDKAISLYRDAGSLATRVATDFRTRELAADPNKPERAAWNAEKIALDPNAYEFLQADAEMQKGNFYARSASEAKIRLDMINTLKPILTAAGQSLPPTTMDENNPDLAKQAKDAAGTGELGARGSFANAIAILDKLATGTSPIETRTAAKAEEIFSQYAWSTLEAAAGDAQAAADHLEKARGLVNGAATESIPLPALPPELAPAAPVAPPR